MKTKTINVYEYGELSKEAKRKALAQWKTSSMEHTTDYATIKESIALSLTLHELKEIKYNIEMNRSNFTHKQLKQLFKLIANNAMVITE